MRHQKAGRRFNRGSAHRKSMFRNLITSLVLHGRIQTTEAKAKELRRFVERVLTMGKQVAPSSLVGLEGEALERATARRVHHIRTARRLVTDREALGLIFNDYAERFKERPGGYTRVIKSGFRAGDNAPMAIIELVGESGPVVGVGENADEVASQAE